MSAAYEPIPCVVCGHRRSTAIADRESIRAEVESLWAFHGRRLRATTPPDRLTDRVAFSLAPPIRLVRCDECGLVYRNPAERGREVAETYRDGAPDDDVLRSLHETQLASYRDQAGRLLETLGRRGSVLEVGSYVGGFLAAARELQLTAAGVDVNPAVNEFTRALGFTVHDGEIGSIEPAEPFDAVAIWNTFDQLVEPRAALVAARHRLREGGLIVLRVPNGALYARLRRRLDGPWGTSARTLLALNNLLGFPYRFGFTPRALSLLLTETGFTVRRIHGDVLVPTADEWTRPWARFEERVAKAAMRQVARTNVEWAPWFEVYGTRD